jgi:HSP20 family protein
MHNSDKKRNNNSNMVKRDVSFVPLRQVMDEIFDRSFLDTFSLGDWKMPSFDFPKMKMDFPRVDISEKDKEVKIKANVPGINPNNINIQMGEDWISISGRIEKEKEKGKKEDKYYRYEREEGKFFREFSLPVVNPDKAEAIVEDGVLTIKAPKIADKKKKKISVKKK